MPKSPRTARRAARPGPPRDIAGLRAAIAAARLPGHPAEVTEQARGLLLSWLAAASLPFPTAVAALASGEAARIIALALLARSPEPQGLACAAGCAFCCLLPGDDGGTITGAEARDLHAALLPLRGAPDGREWHADACPALDPETRLCRAYDARPLICRTYVSRDAAACEAIAAGDPQPGTGTLPAQIAHITAHALARAAITGTARAPTYSLKATAAAALDGTPPDAARHSPASLDSERRRLARGLARQTAGR